MLRQNTYLNAATVAQSLAARNIHLTTRPASLLGELLDLSVSPFAVKTTDEPRILVNSQMVAGSKLSLPAEQRAEDIAWITGDHPEPSQHSLKIQAIADDLAPYITSHLSFARNTVLPLVLDFSNKLDQFLTNARPVDPSSLFEIEQRSVPALVSDESFLSNGLENYAGVNANYPERSVELPLPVDEGFYAELVNLGNDRLNELVKQWLGLGGLEKIKQIYINNFVKFDQRPADEGIGVYYLGLVGQSTTNPYDRLDISLAVYIIATKLFENVQPAEGLSLPEYKLRMRGYIDYAGAEAMKAINALERQFKGQVMVVEAVVSKKRLVVNKAIYQGWLQAGGSPEILYGMLASGQISYSVSGIEAIKDKLQRAWQQFVMLAAANVKTELYQRYIRFIESEFALTLNELTEQEKLYAVENPSLKAKVLQLAKKELEHLHHRVMDDPHHVALHLVAKARFYYTSAYTILNQMAVAAKENPDLDPREAALLSTINYIVEFIDEQLEIVR